MSQDKLLRLVKKNHSENAAQTFVWDCAATYQYFYKYLFSIDLKSAKERRLCLTGHQFHLKMSIRSLGSFWAIQVLSKKKIIQKIVSVWAFVINFSIIIVKIEAKSANDINIDAKSDDDVIIKARFNDFVIIEAKSASDVIIEPS